MRIAATSPFVDHALARRLEEAEGSVCAGFAEARARIDPEVGAACRVIDGTFATFDGVGSPITQTFGLGMTGAIDASLPAIEAFFDERGAATSHEVSPLAGAAVFATLARRGYAPIEVSNVLVRALDDPDEAIDGALRVRVAEGRDEADYVATSASGWAIDEDGARMIRGLARATLANRAMTSFLVEHEGRPIATGALGVHDGVALFAGASTIPSARKRGAQHALFVTRLAEARRRGCALAMMAAEPGSTSQRNAERNGFRVAYTRVKWSRAAER